MVLVCFFISSMTIKAQETEDKKDIDQLLNRIEELEIQLKKIEEENKARKKLEVTDEEKVQKEKEVLEAAGTEYTLDPRRTLGLDYGVSYSYSPSEAIYTKEQLFTLQRNADHTIEHTLSASYSLRDNMSVSTSIPFVYRYNKRGTDEELDQTDIGDMSFGLGWQPFKTDPGGVRTTLSFGVGLPTGRSPYKINPKTELSTGSGFYSVSAGASFSKQVDPVVVFWKVGYGHSFDLDGIEYHVSDIYTLEKVESGDSFNVGGGLGFALSYTTSINLSFNYSYGFSSKYTYKELKEPIKSGDTTSASFGVGMGWRVSPKLNLVYSLSYSLTGSSFSFSLRVPFTFVL